MFLILLSILLHPYHVSVCEVVYDDQSKAVQISQRIFIDDLEKGVSQENGDSGFVMMEDSLQTHEYLQSYFEKNFTVSVNGNNTNYDYLGGEIEDDVIWCYLEVTAVAELESISLVNTILTEVYDDQKNLVHFKIGGEKKSYILTETDVRASYPKK